MEIVAPLLMFNCSQREENWKLHLFIFKWILPLFVRYDHKNYAKQGAICITEVHQRLAEMLKEFKQGNFVVKRSSQKFNQVDPDQSQEWQNGIGKKGGGIIGIIKTHSAYGPCLTT
ncbi:unnamed protein product [Caretta caretta]